MYPDDDDDDDDDETENFFNRHADIIFYLVALVLGLTVIPFAAYVIRILIKKTGLVG
jgi:flagellar biogenesis protein FliO